MHQKEWITVAIRNIPISWNQMECLTKAVWI
jgi:hypothetical protein